MMKISSSVQSNGLVREYEVSVARHVGFEEVWVGEKRSACPSRIKMQEKRLVTCVTTFNSGGNTSNAARPIIILLEYISGVVQEDVNF
ncbi:hypothetical protein P5673_021195 [Acropora cervicornis]|uniref:Uncharacterized protein n=1 Tax=Acropora cervicornis TaxID=6130 RepID=A0AAD9Q8F2_ACRCE|nr:hypothetical protein P5673_021195 [Acropora cervicornis]